MISIDKVNEWWCFLPEENKVEIFENNCGVDFGSNSWSLWWDNYISDKEKIQIYEDFNFIPEDIPDDEKNFYRKGGYER